MGSGRNYFGCVPDCSEPGDVDGVDEDELEGVLPEEELCPVDEVPDVSVLLLPVIAPCPLEEVPVALLPVAVCFCDCVLASASAMLCLALASFWQALFASPTWSSQRSLATL